MSTESNNPETPTPVEVNPPTDAIVESGSAVETEELRQETQALIDAIRKRAQMDAESAGDFTRETYLNAVRQLRETVEANKLFDPEQIEKSFEQVQQEAEKNWQSVVNEITDIGDRFSEAAKVAWDIITKSQEDDAS